MLNLDKAFDYFDEVYSMLVKTGTLDVAIMKSNAPAEEVLKTYGKYLDKLMFMPKVDLDDPAAAEKLDSYLRRAASCGHQNLSSPPTPTVCPSACATLCATRHAYGTTRYGRHMPEATMTTARSSIPTADTDT